MAKFILQPLVSSVTPIKLDECKGYSLGKEENDIVLSHTTVSPKHCIFVVKPMKLQVLDIRSKFGTYVNGKKIQPYTLVDLAVNDIIGICNDETQDINLNEPHVYRLEVYDIKEEECEIEEKHDGEFSEIPNKKIKIENCDCDVIDLTDDGDDYVYKLQETSPLIEKIDFDISEVKEEKVTDDRKDTNIEVLTDKQSSNSVDVNQSNNRSQGTDQSPRNNDRSLEVRPYPSRKMIVYNADNVSITKRNKSPLTKNDQANFVSNKELKTVEGSTLDKADASSNIELLTTAKQSSDSIAAVSSINKQSPDNERKKITYQDLIHYLKIKQEKEEPTEENESLVLNNEQSNCQELESTLISNNNDNSVINQKCTAGVDVRTTTAQIDCNTVMQSLLSKGQPYDLLECLGPEDFDEILKIDIETDNEANISPTKTAKVISKNLDTSFSSQIPTMNGISTPSTFKDTNFCAPQFDNHILIECRNQFNNDDNGIFNTDVYINNKPEETSIQSASCSLGSCVNLKCELPVEFLLSVFKWVPLLLKKHVNSQFNLPIIPYSSSYKNYEDYYCNMTLLILREMWASIDKRVNEKRKKKNPNICGFIIKKLISQISKGSKNLIEFEIDLKETENINIGDLLLLKLSCKSEICAYVKNDEKVLAAITSNCNNQLKRLTIITESLPGNINYVEKIEIQVVYNIKSFVQMAQAVECLKSSPLLPIIAPYTAKGIFLKPEVSNYKAHNFVIGNNLDDNQKDIVLRITNGIVEGSPKIYFIDGLPGTGKSHIIVGIVTEVMNIYQKKKKKRQHILVCAPTNAAVDSITMKLAKIYNRLKTANNCTPFRIVRVGSPASIREEFYHAGIVRLAETMDRRDVFTGTDVIVCKLSLCYSYQMELAFTKGWKKISACFIDDATLYSEPESLIPLILGVDQLVLVGDSKELPARYYSHAVKKCENYKSLFSRIYEIFQFENHNPVITLQTQFRTAVEIIAWPTNYFYGGVLHTNVCIPETWPLHSYKVFDRNSNGNEDNHSYMMGEVNFVMTLLDMIISSNFGEFNDTICVGVIALEHQRQLIKNKWTTSIKDVYIGERKKVNIDFKTIGNIQEQEYDIIIVPCGRTPKLEFLTNEERLLQIFTHVKYSLFICGDFKLFQSDKIWSSLLQDACQRGSYESIDHGISAENLKNAKTPLKESSTVVQETNLCYNVKENFLGQQLFL